MRAVRFDKYGDIDVLQVVDVDPPVAGPGQVIVRVKAAGINPGETGIREGQLHDLWPATFPEGEGSDLAGVVDSVGDGVTEFAPGDEVFGFTDNRASHAELVLVEPDHIVAKPGTVPWEVAGSLFVVGTSAVALVDAAGVGADDIVVVSGAAGGAGSVTAQWARLTGATVIGLAGPENHAWLAAHGIIGVDYHGDDLPGRIRAAADGQVSALLDTFGAPYPQLGLDLGVPPDRIATIADFTAGELGAQVVLHSSAANAAVLTTLGDAVADGRLEVTIAATYPLAQVRDAYRDLAAGHTRGKRVLLL